jgi:hypothetical protein
MCPLFVSDWTLVHYRIPLLVSGSLARLVAPVKKPLSARTQRYRVVMKSQVGPIPCAGGPFLTTNPSPTCTSRRYPTAQAALDATARGTDIGVTLTRPP